MDAGLLPFYPKWKKGPLVLFNGGDFFWLPVAAAARLVGRLVASGHELKIEPDDSN